LISSDYFDRLPGVLIPLTTGETIAAILGGGTDEKGQHVAPVAAATR
jgi:hypothetical protein